MPVGLGIMQSGRISVYTTNTTFFSLTPTSGSAYCNSSLSFVINVQNITTPFHSTSIGIGSNGVPLQTSTISVLSTAGFPNAGSIFIGTINTIVNYTGITSNSFTGCSGGSGTLVTSQSVTSAPLPPQGSVYIQDLITGAVLSGGTGTLAPHDQSNSRVTLTPTIPIGPHNLVVFYVGQDGNTYDIFHQFKASQSSNTSYPIAQILTAIAIAGASSFAHGTLTSYHMTITPSVSPAPSIGTVTLIGKQGNNPSVTIGHGTPSAGGITISIPSNTFTAGALVLTATYIDSTDGCYGPSSGTLNVTVT